MSVTKRPKNGYATKEKEKYRNIIWDSFVDRAWVISDFIKSEDRVKILIMPSKEGLEIETLLNKGFKEKDIVCVDDCPAEIATSEWRKRRPNVHFFGCKLSKAGEKISKQGWVIAAANLDMCYNFSQEMLYEINTFLEKAPTINHFFFAFTIMKGRETKALTLLLKSSEIDRFFDEPRSKSLMQCLKLESKDIYKYLPVVKGDYVSNKFSVSYGGVIFISNRKIADKDVRGELQRHLSIWRCDKDVDEDMELNLALGILDKYKKIDLRLIDNAARTAIERLNSSDENKWFKKHDSNEEKTVSDIINEFHQACERFPAKA